MAISHVSKLFGVNDAAVYKLSTDPAGSAPTYGSSVNVVGVQSLELTLGTDTKTLRGDNTLLAADSVIKDLTGKLIYAKMNFDVWSALTTVTTTDSGTTPNSKVTFTLSQTDLPSFFKVEAQSKQVDYVGGDIHVLLYKCIPGNLLAGFAEEDYRHQEFDVTAVPLIGTITGGPANAWMSLIANETVVAVP